MRSASVTSSSVARKAATRWCRQVGDETDRVGQDRAAARTAARAAASSDRASRRARSAAATSARGQAVEQGGFAGIGVAHQRHHRIGHALARLAMERAGAAHVLELALQDGDAVGDEAAVDLELAFAGAAEEAEAAALALEMGPGPHQPRALIGQRRQLDLEAAFMRARARAENLEDQAGAVDDLAFPGALEIALLHRAHGGVDHDDARSSSSSIALAQPLDTRRCRAASPAATRAAARPRHATTSSAIARASPTASSRRASGARAPSRRSPAATRSTG